MTDKIKKTYELAYFLSSSIKEDDVLDHLKKIREILTKHDCEVIKEDLPQSRRLAYPIKKQKEGYFGYLHFTSDTSSITELNHAFNLSDDLLRHLITEVSKKQLEQLAQDLMPASRPNTQEKETKDSVMKEGAKSQVEENKAAIEKLDEKLEEILK